MGRERSEEEGETRKERGRGMFAGNGQTSSEMDKLHQRQTGYVRDVSD